VKGKKLDFLCAKKIENITTAEKSGHWLKSGLLNKFIYYQPEYCTYSNCILSFRVNRFSASVRTRKSLVAAVPPFIGIGTIGLIF